MVDFKTNAVSAPHLERTAQFQLSTVRRNAESARKDPEERDVYQETLDSISRIRARLMELESVHARARQEIPADEQRELEDAQSRADAAAAYMGERVSSPKLGETALEYRRRLLDALKQHSPQMKNSRFDSLDRAGLEVIEPVIYRDVVQAGKIRAKPGQLIAVKHRDAAGREITEHYGDIGVFLAPFAHTGMHVRINANAGR